MYEECQNAILALLEDAYHREDHARIERWCAQVLPELEGLAYPALVFAFKGYLALASARLSHDASQAAALVEQAAGEFLSYDWPFWQQLSLEILQAAMHQAHDQGASARLAVLYLPAALEQIIHQGDRSYLEPALEIARSVQALPGEDGRFFSACVDLLLSQQAVDADARRRSLASARRKALDQERFAELLQRLGLTRVEPPQDRPDIPYVSPKVRGYLARKEWLRASAQLRVDLDEAEHREPGSTACQTLAAQLALLLQQSIDFVPQQREALADQVKALVVEYGPSTMEDAQNGIPGQAELEAANSGNLGWAATAFSSYIQEGRQALLESGARLLEQAVRLTPLDQRPEDFSINANNLSMAYRDLVWYDRQKRQEYLQKAEHMIRQVIKVDAEMLQSSDPARQEIGKTLYIDYANLGHICFAMARDTYTARWIDKKSLESARWYREALNAYRQSRDLADRRQRVENAGDAERNMALIYLEVCNHYALERYWCGSDLMRPMHDWLCEFSGGPVNSGGLIQSCAINALVGLTHAAYGALDRNPMLLIECLDSLVALWSLGSWRETVSPEIGRHCLAALLEISDEITTRGMTARFAQDLQEIPGLQKFWDALLRIETYHTGTEDISALQAAYLAFSALARNSSGLVRALARPYTNALDCTQQEEGMQVNGLFVHSTEKGIELRIPAQRRSIWLSGPRILSQQPTLRPVSYVRALSSFTVAHLQAMFNWNDLPREILTGLGQGYFGEEELTIETVRLPTSSWDAWLIRMSTRFPPQEQLSISLPFIGLYDLETSQVDTAFPARLDRSIQLLLFGDQGITLEVIAYQDEQEAAAHAPVSIQVGGRPDKPELKIGVREIICVLKTSPRIASSDVGFVVR